MKQSIEELAELSTHAEIFEVEPHVQRLGFSLPSLPPEGAVGCQIIQRVEQGGWAAWMQLKSGDELLLVNDQVVATLHAKQFRSLLAHRPLRLKILPSTSELTTLCSKGSVTGPEYLEKVGPKNLKDAWLVRHGDPRVVDMVVADPTGAEPPEVSFASGHGFLDLTRPGVPLALGKDIQRSAKRLAYDKWKATEQLEAAACRRAAKHQFLDDLQEKYIACRGLEQQLAQSRKQCREIDEESKTIVAMHQEKMYHFDKAIVKKEHEAEGKHLFAHHLKFIDGDLHFHEEESLSEESDQGMQSCQTWTVSRRFPSKFQDMANSFDKHEVEFGTRILHQAQFHNPYWKTDLEKGNSNILLNDKKLQVASREAHRTRAQLQPQRACDWPAEAECRSNRRAEKLAQQAEAAAEAEEFEQLRRLGWRAFLEENSLAFQ